MLRVVSHVVGLWGLHKVRRASSRGNNRVGTSDLGRHLQGELGSRDGRRNGSAVIDCDHPTSPFLAPSSALDATASYGATSFRYFNSATPWFGAIAVKRSS